MTFFPPHNIMLSALFFFGAFLFASPLFAGEYNTEPVKLAVFYLGAEGEPIVVKPESAPGSADPSCSRNFNEFLHRFEESREFQQNNIVYPLRHTYVDPEAEPEPATIKRNLSRAEVLARKEAIYPSAQIQQSVPLRREIEDRSGSGKTVRLYKPDTGYLLRYNFELINGCWQLTEFEDLSI